MTAAVETMKLSQLVRAGSRAEHTAAESSDFVARLLDGRAGRDEYAAYVRRLAEVYDALESVGRAHADDPMVGVVVDPLLERGDALAADLAHWVGPDWRATPLDSPATAAYVDRIRTATAEWGGLYIAHHYTRYLGDLSGGQAIGRVVARTYDLPSGVGTAFYAFSGIPKPKPYKDAYRTRLDALRLSEVDKQRIVGEVKRAFRLNEAIFAELAAR
ncbi:biliverdin-producing heme oxygenase [Solicola gregarius]|uniref:Biliverdin-producing heme oxygenase n=1 Tax=Solicola gregarius TaxID=2908642 RepID=A0AA46TG77_9ACTN|nr:biliverdin-producing heme oxygenase [Solicola gregarius]UYM03983.1 biliverdin-producing heme oxygenase [Solicola gregarius]